MMPNCNIFQPNQIRLFVAQGTSLESKVKICTLAGDFVPVGGRQVSKDAMHGTDFECENTNRKTKEWTLEGVNL